MVKYICNTFHSYNKYLLLATSSSGQTKTNMQRKREQLRLALEWNRVDIAKNFIMKNDRDWEIDLNDLFTLALNNDQIAFVKLFLDHDFSLTDLFRNHDKFITLYTNDQNETDNFRNNYNDPLRTIYKKIIQPLIGDFFDVDAVFPSADTTAAHEMIKNNEDKACFCCNPRRYHKTEVNDPNGSIHSEGTTGYSAGNIDIDKELFLWSVIKGRRDFALLFWSRCKNKICAALVATLIYRKRARKENDQSYNLSADEFENLAVQILDKFYQSSYHACTKAIIRQIPAYGNVTWLELAVAAEAKQFIAQRAVQDVLNDIWYGYIDQRVPDRKIVFSTIMLWYSGLLPYQSELVKTDPESLFIENTINKSRLLQTCEQKRYIDRKTDTVHMRLLTGLSNGDNIPVEFVKIGCWEKTKAGVVKYFTNVATFMSAPFVKYIYNLYFHVFFLLLFSYVILCDFFPLYDFPVDKCAASSDPPNYNDNVNNNNKNHQSDQDHSNTNKPGPYGLQRHTRPATTELILAAWVFTLLCEEIRQLFSTEAQSKRNAISAYFKNFWNKLDVLAIILFFTAFTLRFIPIAECFCAARIILSLDLTIWFMRSLDIFAAVKRLGPKLVMIGEMVHDLKFFMLMLIVFILAFGVSSYSLIYGVRPFTWHLPREIVNLAYWQIFGELNALEKFEHDYKANGYAVFILLVAYMAVVSMLLINLLIAMFRTKAGVVKYFTNVATFMSAPFVKYIYNLYFHVFFLLLFSYVILCDFFPLYDFPVDKCAASSDPPNYNDNVNNNNKNHQSDQDHSNTNKPGPYGLQRHTRPATTELILAAWVFTLLCEEIRQLFSTEAQSKRNAISAYFKNFWNKLDVLAIILFFTAFTLRFIPIAECFCAARIILSLDLTIWFMRSLDIFAAVKRLGPKLVMIGEMVHDLKFFMLMLIVFILAFGVSSYSLIYGVRPFTWHLPREIVNLAYWQIFGELNALEKFEHDYKANGYAVFILLVAYMAVVSILLINLLIAMFSNTFDRLQTDTDRIWKFQRYSLVCEYLSRPSLPPPFIFISHLWRFILYTSARCCRCRPIQARYAQHSSGTKYKTLLNEKYTSIIEIAEDALGDEVYYTHLKLGRKLVDETDLDEERVQTPQENMFNKMRTLENRIQTMSNQQAHMFEYLECLMEGLKIMGGDRIKTPETRRFDPEESFDESSGTGDRSKQIFRRESTFDEHHRHSISSPDESQSSMINFFPSRKNVTNCHRNQYSFSFF
ncbi:unnamed protein product [Adineta steineri]|uniref:Uncharacterized protein n=1 Tax=Adineta steineri TaxID=433720 RepID=A0A813S0F2_9BILA|nr:unnamed protein product [Adineta steineri]